VSWPDLSQLPASVRPTLRDPATGRRLFMRTARGYTFRPKANEVRQLEIEVSDSPQGLLTVTTSAAQVAGRGAAVTYSLSRDARVTLEVRNLAGRPIATIAPRETQAAGRNAVTWSGRTDDGVTAPAGRYLIRIIARSADGQEASALTTVTTGG
jgi:flagellar hook assembly protein FlgD